PSGNAIAAMNAIELDRLDDARAILSAFAQQLDAQAEGMSSMIQAATMYLRRADPIRVTPSRDTAAADRPLTPQQLAAGIVKVAAEWRDDRELLLKLSILGGFHINANRADEN